jgi:iron uptake system EfeUOB component EfeO/EfeM
MATTKRREPPIRRWAPIGIAMVGVAIGVFFVLTALGAGARARTARRAAATSAPLATYSVAAPHVLSSLTVYPVGGDFQKPGPQDSRPVPTSSFHRPIARYRAYAVAQLGLMESQIASLEGALAADDRAGAQAAWRAAYARYLRLGAVYLDGEVATLNQEIDGSAGGLEGGVKSPRFMGLHRIEYELWTGAPPSALLGWARRLDVAVRRLRSALPHVSIAPLEYATRAHEILEDAQRDLLSGADVPYSGEGLLATEAGLEATEEVVSTLRPVFRADARVVLLPALATEFAALRSALASIAAAHGGRLPSNGQLTQPQSELLDGTLGGALEALSLVPDELETEELPRIPQIPRRDVRIDP